MALRDCRECGNAVATSARACPHCGAPSPPSLLKFLFVGGAAALVGLCFVQEQIDASKPKPPPAAPEAPLTVGAVDLTTAYRENEVAADQRYRGKLVVTTGVVDDVGKDMTDTIYVTLGPRAEGREVQAFFDERKAGEVTGLRPGDRLTVRGRVSGLMGNVLVYDCDTVL